MINTEALVSTSFRERKSLVVIWIVCIFLLLNWSVRIQAHLIEEIDRVHYSGSFELMDVYGDKGLLQYTDGCVAGDSESCEIKIAVNARSIYVEEFDPLDEPLLGYINYLSHLKRTGQILRVRFTPILTDVAAEVIGYRIHYATDNARMTVAKRMDPLLLPSVLDRNPLLLFSVLATHQSSLDLLLSPSRDVYIKSLEWAGQQTLKISIAGRGGSFGYRYYSFPKDNELFLDLGGPFSINSLSEGVAFSFPTSDKTIPPMRMVTGYHSDQREWLINRASAVAAYATIFSGVGVSIWNRSLVGGVMSALLMLVELRTGAASSELQGLAKRILPESLQFNPRYQGRYILKVLRSESEEIEPLL